MHVCIRVHSCVCACVRACILSCMHVCIRVHSCVCVYHYMPNGYNDLDENWQVYIQVRESNLE